MRANSLHQLYLIARRSRLRYKLLEAGVLEEGLQVAHKSRPLGEIASRVEKRAGVTGREALELIARRRAAGVGQMHPPYTGRKVRNMPVRKPKGKPY